MGKKKTKKQKNNKKTKTFSFQVLKQKSGLLLSLLIVLVILCLFINSDLWPWPSVSKTKSQLSTVIETCVNNEKSSECSEIKTKYKATFIYCYSLFDAPNINEGTHVYGVAYRDKTSIPKYKGDFAQAFYGCSEYKENVGKNIPEESITKTNNPALILLAEIPYDLTNCASNAPNYIWELVPAIESIKTTFNSIKIQYNNKCYPMRDAFAPTRTKMINYANNLAVKRFFAEFGNYLSPQHQPAYSGYSYQTIDGKTNIDTRMRIDSESLSEYISSKINAADSSDRLVYKRI